MRRSEVEQISKLKVISEFLILHEGWEMDNQGWVLEDGSLRATNHGGLYVMDQRELEGFLRTTKEVVTGLEDAVALADLIRRLRQDATESVVE